MKKKGKGRMKDVENEFKSKNKHSLQELYMGFKFSLNQFDNDMYNKTFLLFRKSLPHQQQHGACGSEKKKWE